MPMARYRRKRTIAVSRNSEENEYSVLGLGQLILDGIDGSFGRFWRQNEMKLLDEGLVSV